MSDDPDESVIDVCLIAVGVPYDDQATALLALFDQWVASGDVVGTGPGHSASGRLHEHSEPDRGIR